MRPGIDCAFAGSTADFNQAATAGVEWVGEYFGGEGCYHVWTNNDRAALAASRIPYRLPIWVPNQSFSSDPIQEANQAIAAHEALGFHAIIALDAESNSGFSLEWGEVFGNTIRKTNRIAVLYHGNDKPLPSTFQGDWVAFWTGNAPTHLDSQKAIQYRGNTTSYGMSVDFSMAADDFPLEGLPTISTGGTMEIDIAGLPKGKLNGPILATASTSNRLGGWLVGADGGVFCWGNAEFYGSASNVKLAGKITCIVPASDDKGYTLIGSDGGTFEYGPHAPNIPSLA